MALANVAVQLARLGHGVLMVDWDLEAPGLERYFQQPDIPELKVKPADDPTGLLGLLSLSGDSEPESSLWEQRLSDIAVPPNPLSYSNLMSPTPGRLHLLGSGFVSTDYAARLSTFSWDRFFAEESGGTWLEALRTQWALRYDFVLIDARTGLTDSGGVCTVQMPDWLVLVFTANEQSLTDGLRIVNAAQQGRRNFTYDRSPLAVVPLLSRWCGDDEVDIGQQWLQRLDKELRPLVSSWLPQGFTPRDYLEKIRVPQIARFAFGEPLPVLTHSLTDTNLPGSAYHTLARLLSSRLAGVGQIIDPSYTPSTYKAGLSEDIELKTLALVKDSEALYREIAKISKTKGPDSEALIDFLHQAGTMLHHVAQYKDAEPLLRRSLILAEQRYGENHPSVAVRLNQLALLLRDTNRLLEAEPLMRRALAIDEQNLGTDHRQIAAYLSNLARIMHQTNRSMEAEPLLVRALEINIQCFGENHPNVAISLNNLAQLLHDTNRLTEAEPLMRHALAIDEHNLGSEHPNVAIRLNNLAQLLRVTGRLVEAEPLIRRALAIDEHSFGADHPNIAIRLNNLALLLKESGRSSEAEPLMRRALAIREKSFGADHPDVAIQLNNLALLLKNTGQVAEAKSFSQRAVKILEDFKNSSGYEHKFLESARVNYQGILDILTELDKEK